MLPLEESAFCVEPVVSSHFGCSRKPHFGGLHAGGSPFFVVFVDTHRDTQTVTNKHLVLSLWERTHI